MRVAILFVVIIITILVITCVPPPNSHTLDITPNACTFTGGNFEFIDGILEVFWCSYSVTNTIRSLMSRPENPVLRSVAHEPNKPSVFGVGSSSSEKGIT